MDWFTSAGSTTMHSDGVFRAAVGTRLLAIAVAIMFGLLRPGSSIAVAADIVGVVTEIKGTQGRVEIRTNGSAQWRNITPLLGVHPGDVIRTTGDSWTNLTLIGGNGNVRVDQTNSPYAVSDPRIKMSVLHHIRILADEAIKMLSTRHGEPRRISVSTRVNESPLEVTLRLMPPPLTVITPRDGRVLPGALSIEWISSSSAGYTVRIKSPTGVLWERRDLAETQVTYPADAPTLLPSVRHVVEVSDTTESMESAWFEVLDPDRADGVRRDLSSLPDALGATVSSTSLTVVQVALLADRGLLHDARAKVLMALPLDPGEPTLYALLGDIYGRIGLPGLATQAYRRVDELMARPRLRR